MKHNFKSPKFYVFLALAVFLVFGSTRAIAVINIKMFMNSAYEYLSGYLYAGSPNYYGGGAQGALTVAATSVTDGTRTYINSAGATSAGSTTVNVPAGHGMVSGDEVVIIQMLGTGVGTYETKNISSTTATTLTFSSGTLNSYPAHAAGSAVTQIVKIPHYTTVTVQNGGTLKVNSFNGLTGGVMFFRASGAVNIQTGGTISTKGTGYRGGYMNTSTVVTGEGPTGGAGGGATGVGGTNTTPASTKRAIMGSGGGGAGTMAATAGTTGGSGGGVMIIKTNNTLTIDGTIDAGGGRGGNYSTFVTGGGAGGTMLISAATITRTTTCGTFTAVGAVGFNGGTTGGGGRSFAQYKTTLNCTNITPSSTATYWKFTEK